jgi:hypothetical protein
MPPAKAEAHAYSRFICTVLLLWGFIAFPAIVRMSLKQKTGEMRIKHHERVLWLIGRYSRLLPPAIVVFPRWQSIRNFISRALPGLISPVREAGCIHCFSSVNYSLAYFLVLNATPLINFI